MTLRHVALVYARRSVVKQFSDEVSPEAQRVHGIAECERRGWTAELYQDAEGHRSGRYEQGRPGWLTLKAQLDRPEIVAVIVESLSRASRSIKDLFSLIELLTERDIALISLKEQIDTTTAMGRAFIGVIAVINQFESDIASERMAERIEYRRTEKGRHWGRTPFGCDREGEDHVLVPSKGGATIEGIWRGYHEALRQCYEWFAVGDIGFTELSDRLNDAGFRYRDRHGQPRRFTQADVRRIIHSHPIYSGHILRGAAKDHPSEILPGSHAAILPLELCERVRDQLAARKVYGPKHAGPLHADRLYLLSDLLYCAGCGAKLVGMWQDGQPWYRHDRGKQHYHCASKGQFKAVLIESQVMDRLDQFRVPEQMKERIRQLAQRLIAQQGPGEWQTARRSLERLARKLDNLKAMRLEGEYTKAEYDRLKAEIEAQQSETQKTLAQAPTDVQSLDDLLGKVDQIAEIIRAGTAEQKKRLFNSLFERIEERDGELTLLRPREWARPFFNGGHGVHVEEVAESDTDSES